MSDDLLGEPLLSGAETDALLEAMRSGTDEASSVEGADLGSPDRPLRQALGRADRCTQEFAPEVRKVLLHATSAISTTEDQPSEIVPFNVLSNAILPGSSLATVRTRDESFGLVILGPSLAAFVVERRLGAPTETEDTPPLVRNELTSIDRRLLRPFVEKLCEGFSSAWTGTPTDVRLAQLLKGVNELPPLTQFEPLLRIGVRTIPAGNVGDEVIVALTAGAVRATTTTEPVEQKAVSQDDKHRLVEGLAATQVELVAVLGTTSSSVGEVIGLQEGHVLRLDGIPEEPIALQVEGVTKLRGMPVIHHGNLAVEVSNTL